jgi:hypothetical protein
MYVLPHFRVTEADEADFVGVIALL